MQTAAIQKYDLLNEDLSIDEFAVEILIMKRATARGETAAENRAFVQDRAEQMQRMARREAGLPDLEQVIQSMPMGGKRGQFSLRSEW